MADALSAAEHALASALLDLLNQNNERIPRCVFNFQCASCGLSSHAVVFAKFRRLGIIEEYTKASSIPGYVELMGRDGSPTGNAFISSRIKTGPGQVRYHSVHVDLLPTIRLTGLVPPGPAPPPDGGGDRTGGTADGQVIDKGSSGNKRRPAWGRDHLFLEWKGNGLKPAEIREKWNDMNECDRRKICPECFGLITGSPDSTRQVVKNAISKAAKEI